AFKSTNGTVRIILINKGNTYAAQTHVSLKIPGLDLGSGQILTLQAPSLAATSGVTLGGAGVSGSGGWAPQSTRSIKVVNSTLDITVPKASAVLVTLIP